MRTTKLGLAITSLALALAACGTGEVGAGDEQGTIAAELSTGPKVYLNHSYGMMSAATVTALQSNAYLKNQFIDVEVRTTVRPDTTYTGTYLNAQHTYLEYFPEGTFGFPAGVTGLALGDESVNGAEAVAAKWAKEFGDAGVEGPYDVSHEINGVQVPWFRTVDATWTYTSDWVALWDMEYFPNAGAQTPRTRVEERSARYHPEKLAQDVVAISYAFPLGDLENIRRSLRSLGWKIDNEGVGFSATSPKDNGTQRVLFFQRNSPGRLGMLGVRFALNRQASHTEVIGDARLEVGVGGRKVAFLWFVAPTAADRCQLNDLND